MTTVDTMPTAAGARPLVGHLVPLLRDPLGFLASLPEQGGVVRVRVGPTSIVILCDPQLLHDVLRNDRVFDKGGQLFDRYRESLGDGLGTCPHSRHRRQRRLVQPAFHADRLPGYAEIIAEQSTAAVSAWREGQVLDVMAEMTALAARNVAAALFSDALTATARSWIAEDLATIMAGIFRRMLTPPLLDRLPTPGTRRYLHACTRLRRTINDALAARSTGGTDHGDLLSMLLAVRDSDGRGLSDAEISDQAVTFLMGGAETVGCTLSWALHMLTGHPDLEDRLHQEVDTVLAGRRAGFADLPRLHLTRRVITETLRHYPPAWLVTRRVTTDAEIDGHRVRAGTTVCYSPYLVHHRPDSYPVPDHYDPDRWAPERSQPPRQAFIPFGTGARKCIGEQFGLIETTLALATITSRWHLRPIPGGDRVRPKLVATLIPRGLRLRATARTPATGTPPDKGER
ncbi:pentalenene oxygenase [Saccharothrix tamanrassetensis]|uniref:Pentalenene oxygenase n=1 Tax=Saccharothrix tamanrassetensis TaxID=1051531 RepID=A0A841CWM9_9PSEU|nr:cytochrome P450 [Saccharothrix tamanrassetensis]MBB5960714.1 pentalenene oxygenase [Saccharothrix tamanrassetensis]